MANTPSAGQLAIVCCSFVKKSRTRISSSRWKPMSRIVVAASGDEVGRRPSCGVSASALPVGISLSCLGEPPPVRASAVWVGRVPHSSGGALLNERSGGAKAARKHTPGSAKRRFAQSQRAESSVTFWHRSRGGDPVEIQAVLDLERATGAARGVGQKRCRS